MECTERNLIWGAFGPSINPNLITRVLTIHHVKLTQRVSLEQERFDLSSLTPALRNLPLLPLKLMSQQLLGNIPFVRDHLNVAQQWILLHGSSKIVGLVGRIKYKTNGLLEHYKCRSNSGNLSILSHNVRQVPTWLGLVASVFKLLPTQSNNY